MLKKMGCLGIAMCAALSVVAENREDAGTSLESHLDHAIIAASPQNAHDKSVAHMSQEAEKVAKDLVKLPVTESAVILARMHPEKSSLVFSKLPTQFKVLILQNMNPADQNTMLARMTPTQRGRVFAGIPQNDMSALSEKNPELRKYTLGTE